MVDPGLLQPPPVIVDVTPPSTAPPPVEPPSAPPPAEKSKAWAFVRKYVLAPLPILVIAAVAIVLVMLGAKNLQVGGLIGKLLGRKTSQKAIEVANSVPASRVREDGTLIPIGEPDSKGITQAQVVAIQEPGLFDDPKVIKVTPPGETKPISIEVPDGVSAKDIDKVVVIKPEVLAVTVKSTSKIKAADVDDLLAKYRK